MAQPCRYNYTVFYLLSTPKQKYELKWNLHTLEEHFLITFTNSDMTKSTHFTAGALSLSICRLTIASNAMLGVNRPALHSHTNKKRMKFQKGIQMSRKDAVQITKALVLLKQKRKQDLIKNWQICDPSFLFSLVSVISVWSNFFTTIFGYIESEIWPWLFKSRIALSTG